MQLANDFEFKPLPPIADDISAVTAAVKPNPLGRLAAFTGKWSGTGFNIIWRPNHTPDQDHFLELNLTAETLEFSPINGAIPNRGLFQGDINMYGLTYLQQISDSNLNAGLHVEPGIWANIPETKNPPVPPTVVRMASIPHGTTIVAQGTATRVASAPTIPVEGITPFNIGSPDELFNFDEQSLKKTSQFRTPAAGLVGITQAMVDDPNSVLRAAIAHQTITATDELSVTTNHKPVLGGGTANTAFLTGGTAGPNALAASVKSTFWIEQVKGTPDFVQIQYSQTVLFHFSGLTWPHVSVATLRQVAP